MNYLDFANAIMNYMQVKAIFVSVDVKSADRINSILQKAIATKMQTGIAFRNDIELRAIDARAIKLSIAKMLSELSINVNSIKAITRKTSAFIKINDGDIDLGATITNAINTAINLAGIKSELLQTLQSPTVLKAEIGVLAKDNIQASVSVLSALDFLYFAVNSVSASEINIGTNEATVSQLSEDIFTASRINAVVQKKATRKLSLATVSKTKEIISVGLFRQAKLKDYDSLNLFDLNSKTLEELQLFVVG